ncbi:PilZ domain-containing protein [Myxococcota bacterium]|nr:PilZ domain-containing protein [Myxococcota bacterium]
MTEKFKVHPIVLIPLKNNTSFLSSYFHDGEVGGVFAPGFLNLRPGDKVEIEIVFASEQRVVHSRGKVRWKRMRAARNLPAGIGIEFDPSERQTRDMLLDFANGREVELLQRKSRRFPVAIEIRYATQDIFTTEFTEDLSKEGALIRLHPGESCPPIGTKLKIILKPPSHPRGIHLQAEVMWISRDIDRGVGVRFLADDPKTKKLLNEVITLVKTQIVNSRELL